MWEQFEFDIDERPTVVRSLLLGAALVWISIALSQWWLLLELPVLAALTVWLLRRIRRMRPDPSYEEWNWS